MSLISRIKELAHESLPQRLARDDEEASAADGLRGAMLGLMDGEGSEAAAMLRLRIRCAATLQSLWFMRSELMALLSPRCGESEALHRVELACAAFRESLPSALRSRPSPLSRLR